MDDSSICDVCGFDKPHTHSKIEIAYRGKYNEGQRRIMRELAASRFQRAELRAEFEAGPRAYVRKYGSINTRESFDLVEWLLERIERIERVPNEPEKETA